VVNDATASYYNPAALTLLSKPQIIGLGSYGSFQSQFTGQSVQKATGFTQNGTSNTGTNYFLPSGYIGIPTANRLTFGIAVVSNFFNKDIGETSILRYAQPSNNVQNVDVVPAVGVKVSDSFSIGAGINFSYANFVFEPTTGFPSLNIQDSQSKNTASGTATGADAGILLRPTRATTIGFNYRSAVTYRLSGKSVLSGTPGITSNNYSFVIWTPARSVLSLNQFITPNLGMIATIQRIQWSIFQNLNIHNVATQMGSRAVIINTSVPYHMRNTWLLTLGSYYRINPKWVLRAAGSYVQSPGNGSYQIAEGNTVVLGFSTGYEVYKNILVDGSYAHAFAQNSGVHINSGTNFVNGTNKSDGNAVSLKLTVNV
jgi:long-subunit fatty acid transport protein